MSFEETAGYELFKHVGCAACHSYPAAGGILFMTMGIAEPYATDNLALGRFGVTGDEVDRYVFKGAARRNVELTYPSFGGEEQVIRIAAFLRTLTGQQPRFALPQLPLSGPAHRYRNRAIEFGAGPMRAAPVAGMAAG